MITIDVAIDDYLHTIVRTRPWVIKRETALLEAFSEWLYAQPEPSLDLDAIDPVLVADYVAATDRAPDEHNALLEALHNVYMWSLHTNNVSYNPFAAVMA